jgi:hypothetical protein
MGFICFHPLLCWQLAAELLTRNKVRARLGVKRTGLIQIFLPVLRKLPEQCKLNRRRKAQGNARITAEVASNSRSALGVGVQPFAWHVRRANTARSSLAFRQPSKHATVAAQKPGL